MPAVEMDFQSICSDATLMGIACDGLVHVFIGLVILIYMGMWIAMVTNFAHFMYRLVTSGKGATWYATTALAAMIVGVMIDQSLHPSRYAWMFSYAIGRLFGLDGSVGLALTCACIEGIIHSCHDRPHPAKSN